MRKFVTNIFKIKWTSWGSNVGVGIVYDIILMDIMDKGWVIIGGLWLLRDNYGFGNSPFCTG